MFQGLITVTYQVDNLPKAREWYSGVLGAEQYFADAFYVGST